MKHDHDSEQQSNRATSEIRHVGAFRPLWWLCAALLTLAALWGWPLLDGNTFQHSFYGVFWYSMIGLAAIIWSMPAVQSCNGVTLERRWTWLGLVVFKRETQQVSAFDTIRLEQAPNHIGTDSVWVVFESEIGRRFVFAHFRASHIAKAQALAQQLATLSQLPFAEAPPQADNPSAKQAGPSLPRVNGGEESPGSTGQDAG